MSVLELDQGPLFWKNRIIAAWNVESEYAAEVRKKAERDQRRRDNARAYRGG